MHYKPFFSPMIGRKNPENSFTLTHHEIWLKSFISINENHAGSVCYRSRNDDSNFCWKTVIDCESRFVHGRRSIYFLEYRKLRCIFLAYFEGFILVQRLFQRPRIQLNADCIEFIDMTSLLQNHYWPVLLSPNAQLHTPLRANPSPNRTIRRSLLPSQLRVRGQITVGGKCLW